MRFSGSLVVALALTASAIADKPNQADEKPASGEVKVRVTIGKETTRITQPLRSDGYPDYLEALNQKYSAGVTPENNAVALLWQIVGPKQIPEKLRVEYFRRLGVPVPPENGDYLLDEYAFAGKSLGAVSEEATKKIDADINLATRRPWTAEEFPLLTQWLKTYDKQISLGTEMSLRAKYFSPIVTQVTQARLFNMEVLSVQPMRDIARALAMRAMFRLGAGDKRGAWQDQLALRRLAALSMRGPTLVERLAGSAIAMLATNVTAAVAHFGGLMPSQLQQCRQALKATTLKFQCTDICDECDRYMALDAACDVAAHGFGAIAYLTDPSPGRKSAAAEMLYAGTVIDPDMVMKSINRMFDLQVAAARKADRAERWSALADFERRLLPEQSQHLEAGLPKLADLSQQGPEGRRTASKYVGATIAMLTLPTMMAIAYGEEQAATEQIFNELILALAAYRSDHGNYPERLDQLVPHYFQKLPHDASGDSEFRYERTKEGFRVWSQGRNRQDDDGRGLKDGETWDDQLHEIPTNKRVR